MKTYRSIPSLLILLFSVLFDLSATAGGPGKEVTINAENFAKLSEAQQQHVLEVQERLETLYNIDRSQLTREERRDMRLELKELKKEVNDINAQQPVIYISLTLLLVIVILVLLLR
ncbi:MAG: hypothetical protein M3R08_08395 [Bacteroidota bacterium]|nr:hypothetical protein [Bacteroidota bacterium]